MTASIDYQSLFAANVPPAAARWQGFAPYNFIGGHNDPELVPIDDLRASADRVLRDHGRSLATYHMDDGPQGLLALRQYLVDKLAATRGVRVTTDEILITSGSNHAIDLIAQTLLEPGDTVIAEAFSYAGALINLRKRGANLIGVPTDADGLQTDRLATVLADLQQQGITPKFIYTIPTVQNPTGSVMSVERRHELLDLSRRYGVPIFEDECYADLLWEGDWPPSLRAYDDSNHVLHIGSFSKSLVPAVRLGYAVAGWDVMSRLLACKSDGGTGALDQMVIADFSHHHQAEHVQRLHTGLRKKADATAAALEQFFGTAATFTRPAGGIFLWVQLPDVVDTDRLLVTAAEEGIAFNQGSAWSVDPEAGRHCLRLCFALPPVEQITEGVAKLAEICFREFGVPARSDNRELGPRAG